MENDTETQVLVEWLEAGLRRKGRGSKEGLARALGQHPSVVSRMLKGQPISAVDLATISEFLDQPLPTLFSQVTQPEPVSKKLVRVTRVAAGGVWRESEGKDVLEQVLIHTIPEPKLKGMEQFCARIEGTSRFAIYVPFEGVRSKPRNGDVVVVDRFQGDLVETTIRKVEIDNAVIRMVGYENIHSNLKALTYPVDQTPDDIRIVGLCVGFYERLEV